MNTNLLNEIVSVLAERPGQTAREISAKVGADKTAINSLLFGALKGKCRQDSKYRWWLVNASPKPASPATAQDADAGTPLARLCSYYLACLAQDEDGGISVFASNKFGDLDYSELAELPLAADSDIFGTDGARRLMARMRKDRGRLGMYLGYPCALKHQKSRKSNWEGFFVEPLFLFPAEFEDGPNGAPKLQLGFPLFNRLAIRRLCGSDRDEFLEEFVQLEQELGLTDSDDIPELDELAQRLAAVRPEWPWKEDILPHSLMHAPSLSAIDEAGIYNRAVVVIGERSPYTQGLESELRQIARVSSSDLEKTVLGQWLTLKPSESAKEAVSVIEVLPLNSEQRHAIEQAMVAPLTIITGPPGTGKSQIVTNLLVNAAWHGKRVVFASKNNKAVDVVETRVNNLGPRPILLRVGSNQYQTRLAEYLVSLLSATASTDDIAAFQEAEAIHNRLEASVAKLTEGEKRLVELRNTVDELERQMELARTQLSADQIRLLKTFDLAMLESAVHGFSEAVTMATRKSQSIVLRLFWGMLRKQRFAALVSARDALAVNGRGLGITLFAVDPSDSTIGQWKITAAQTEERVALCRSVKTYLDALAALQSAKSLEEIAKERAILQVQLSANADRLWKSWLRLQPTKLKPTDRQLLQRYSALLRMVINTASDGALAKDVAKEYRNLSAKVSHLLPCWAVTSLSARGKVPFEPGYFDLVVFDEASQCDIASALPLLYRAKRAVIIGDPKQLPHISGMPRGQDQQLLQRFNLVEELPQWAYSFNSLFDLAAGFARGEDIVNLRDHHRSHADIINFSNNKFYEGRLRVATRYSSLKRPVTETAGVRWVNVPGKVTRPQTGGALNVAEAKAVVAAIRDLVIVKGYRGSIGVVSPFRAQANQIRELALADDTLSAALSAQEFLVDTVHKFQGDERDVMLFSPVVSEGITPGAISFLRNNGNLFNVAITRARAQLVVVGDRNAATQCDVEYLADFASYSSELEQKVTTRVTHDLSELGQEYPSVSSPERVSDWERVLYKVMYTAGLRVLPQYQVENYVLDFALFKGDRRLNVEVDGERYHRNWDGELCRRDQIRNQRLIELGWDVMRFWVYEIRDDMDGCIRRIRSWMEGDKQ
jgi:very-short-patch-repair endonuclease